MQDRHSKSSIQEEEEEGEKSLFTSKLGLHLRKKIVKCYIWSLAFYGAENWTSRKVEIPGAF
jgi:hypothetical protein